MSYPVTKNSKVYNPQNVLPQWRKTMMSMRTKIILGSILILVVLVAYLLVAQTKHREADVQLTEQFCEMPPLDYALTSPEKQKVSLAGAKELLSRIQYDSQLSNRLSSWIKTTENYQEKVNQAAQSLYDLQTILQYRFPEEEKTQLSPTKIENLLNAANKVANIGTEQVTINDTSILVSEAFPERLKNIEKLAGLVKEEINGRNKRYNAFVDKLKKELAGGINLSTKQTVLSERVQEIEDWLVYCMADPDKTRNLQEYQNTYRELPSLLKTLEVIQGRLAYVEQEAKAGSLSKKTWEALRKELDEIKIRLDEKKEQAARLGIAMDEINALFSKATIELTKAEGKSQPVSQ